MHLKKKAVALAFLGVAGGMPAFAAQPPAPAGPRTGPDAPPPAAPAFPQPEVQSLVPSVPQQTEPPAVTGSAVTSVTIDARNASPDAHAIPPRGWRPAADPLSGFRIDHRAGEPLNATWAERQFVLNGVADTGRAIALVQLINRAFLSAGFVNSGLLVNPETAPGLLSLQLVHGRLAAAADNAEAVQVRWADGHARGLHSSYVRERMPSARRQPVNAALIERDFRLLAEDPALRTVNAQLRPGIRPGEASLDLVVLPAAPADFYLTAGNSRSPAVGGERYGATARLRNFLASGDLVTLDGGVTAGVIDASFAFSAPIFPRTSFTIRASYNEAAVIDAPLLPLDIQTRDRTFEGSVLHQLLRTPLTPAGEGTWSPSQTLTAGIGFVARQQRSFLLGQPFSFAPGSLDGRAEYGAVRLIGDYVLRNVDQVFAGSITASIGIGGTQSMRPEVLNPDEHFFALLVQLNYARLLSAGGLELRARITGQAADSILYSGERLSLGGESTVRGYRESLILADEGLIGSLEVAQPFSLSGSAGANRPFDWGAFTLAAFADAAYARNRGGPPPVPDAIGSVGVALTWAPSDNLSLRLAYGHALVDVDPTGSRDIQDDGIHVRLFVRPFRLFGAR